MHQTGKADVEAVREGSQPRLQGAGEQFIEDMSAAYAGAELVVCRAGATTLAELTVCKKASILVPFPYATDNHQEVNAMSLVNVGAGRDAARERAHGAEAGRADPRAEGEPGAAPADGEARGLMGRPEAAKELADVCAELMVQTWGQNGRERPGKGSEVHK